MSAALIEQLSRNALLYLIAVLIASVALLYSFIPLWASAGVLLCVIWRLFIFTGKLSFPPTWVKVVCVCLCMTATLFQYRYTLALDMFVVILTLGFSLKLLEVYHKQAAQLLLYLAFFVLMTYLLFEQTLLTGVLSVLQTLLILSALVAIHSDSVMLQKHYLQPIKMSLLVLLVSLPLMAIVFVFVPRVSPFWVMPLQTQQAKTGMSDKMAPGDITRLANSPELVFRATFAGNMPPKQELYWIGFIFDDFDGREWKNECECNYIWVNTDELKMPQPIEKRKAYYQVILEPHGQRRAFALQDSFIQDKTLRSNNDRLFRFKKELVDKALYEASVFPPQPVKPLSVVEQKHYKRLPDGNPETRQLIQQWRNETGSDEALINRILDFYRASFKYTLTPQPLGQNSIDDFLFTTKEGFCEHFASSFVYMMRAAGIPARVVLGYQGGEINQDGNYIIVRQYDAHAWAEVWLNNQWVRVDPTNSVDPQRITSGFDVAFADSTVFKSPLSLNAYRHVNIINWFRLKLEYMDYAWSRWVIGYNEDAQRSLLFTLGLGSPLKMLLWVAGAFLTFFVSFFILLAFKDYRQRREHALTTRYRQLCLSYEKLGFKRRLEETPLTYAGRIVQANLPWANEFLMLSQQYSDWVCGAPFSNMKERRLWWACFRLQGQLLGGRLKIEIK